MSMMDRSLSGQPVIIGAGLAGLVCALTAAPLPVVVVAKSPLGEGAASVWAQGGIAAALAPDDSVALHVADTLAAGDGLGDPGAVRRIVGAASEAIRALESWGVVFERDGAGAYAVSLEGAHSRRRVLHAGAGDTAGARIMQAVIAAVRQTPSITLVEGAEIHRLLVGDGGIEGIAGMRNGAPLVIPTRQVVLATGGIGALWPHTTNPSGALGQGLALAARAGAVLADLEFVQFHPTALDVGIDPMPLASEALRGDGAVLVDDQGRLVMAGIDPRGDLAPRDIVARAVWRRLGEGRRVFLDGRQAIGAAFPRRFPTLTESCRRAGIDPVTAPIPVRPATHYHMGGIAVDPAGQSTVPGLWACGEVAATGLHGANRLASNSLLEAAVTGREVAASLAGAASGAAPLRPVEFAPVEPVDAASLAAVRSIMGRHLGVLRDGAGLQAAVAALDPLGRRSGIAGSAALVAQLVAVAALRRQESRGSHCRTDFPAPAAMAARSYLDLASVPAFERPSSFPARAPIAMGA